MLQGWILQTVRHSRAVPRSLPCVIPTARFSLPRPWTGSRGKRREQGAGDSRTQVEVRTTQRLRVHRPHAWSVVLSEQPRPRHGGCFTRCVQRLRAVPSACPEAALVSISDTATLHICSWGPRPSPAPVQQGDLLGPLLFAFAFHPQVHRRARGCCLATPTVCRVSCVSLSSLASRFPWSSHHVPPLKSFTLADFAKPPDGTTPLERLSVS